MKTWIKASEAIVGNVYRVRFADRLGSYEARGSFFLHDDGCWYRVNPPGLMELAPIEILQALEGEEVR